MVTTQTVTIAITAVVDATTDAAAADNQNFFQKQKVPEQSGISCLFYILNQKKDSKTSLFKKFRLIFCFTTVAAEFSRVYCSTVTFPLCFRSLFAAVAAEIACIYFTAVTLPARLRLLFATVTAKFACI